VRSDDFAAGATLAQGTDRPPLFFVHGAFVGAWCWDAWRSRAEAAGWHTGAPDLRHHGKARLSRSELDDLGTTGLLDYAADLEAQIDALGSAPIIVGHSMGGLLAQILAARGKARALVLLAPSAPWGVLPSTPHEMLSAGGLFLTGDFWSRALLPQRSVAAEHALDKVPISQHTEILRGFRPESGRAMFEILHWFSDVTRASRVHPRDVTCPVLTLVGEHDVINPPATVRRVAARYRERSTFDLVPGHSHWLIGEPGWEGLADQVFDWLGETVA